MDQLPQSGTAQGASQLMASAASWPSESEVWHSAPGDLRAPQADKFSVLLADDDPGLRRLVGTTLGTDDFHLLHAADGVETLEVARARYPDIILLDINMPRLNGLEVCREIKENPSTASIKIVMLTASGNADDRASALEARADDYFVKPFSPVALLNKIYDLLA